MLPLLSRICFVPRARPGHSCPCGGGGSPSQLLLPWSRLPPSVPGEAGRVLLREASPVSFPCRYTQAPAKSLLRTAVTHPSLHSNDGPAGWSPHT